MKEHVKVKVEDLKIGMYVAELDKPWLETSFLFQGFLLGSEKDIKVVADTCKYVYVDMERSSSQPAAAAPPPRTMAHRGSLRTPGPIRGRTHTEVVPRPHKVGFEEELSKARTIHQQARSHIDHMFEDARMGRTVDTRGAKDLVNALVGSIVRNPDALTWMAQLRKKDEYTAQHSLSVCVLTLAFARHLGMDDATMREIGLGAFMHDIGKLRVPLEVLNKPGKLTTGEFQLMKRHPQYGSELLNRSGGVPSSTIDIAFSHHERGDGQGYPRGVRGERISNFAKMVAVVDVYDAISSDRIYHQGKSVQESMKMLYEWRGHSLDADFVEQFIQALGVYPVGSVVELNSGELAVVLSADPMTRLQPKVLVVTNAEKRLVLPRRVVDLAREARLPTSGLAVRRVARPGDVGFDLSGIVGHHKGLLT